MSTATSPLVTVILPTFERAKYLREAIRSALDQTYVDFVISIGDNSRNAETEAVVREFDDPRIRYRRHPENLGQQGNWLWLIHNAETPFVASLHDDDVWCPTFLEKTVPLLRDDPSVSMAFADYELIDQDGASLGAETAELTERSHRDRLAAGTLDLTLPEALRLVAVWNAPQPAYCALLRRDAVEATEFPPEIDPVYDIWLSYQIARRGERFAFVPERLTKYRWHPGSSTTTGWSAPEDEIFSRIICENSDAGDVITEVQEYWASIRWGRAVRMMASSATREASRCRVQGRIGAPAPGQAHRQRHGSAVDARLGRAATGPHCQPQTHGRTPVSSGVPKLAVVICTYRRNEPLRQLLEQLVAEAAASTDLATVGVVVVDDSPDGGAKATAEAFAPRFDLGVEYRNTASGNISTARNAAIDGGVDLGDWLCFIDDDCLPTDGWFRILFAMQQRTGADLITGPDSRRRSDRGAALGDRAAIPQHDQRVRRRRGTAVRHHRQRAHLGVVAPRASGRAVPSRAGPPRRGGHGLVRSRPGRRHRAPLRDRRGGP